MFASVFSLSWDFLRTIKSCCRGSKLWFCSPQDTERSRVWPPLIRRKCTRVWSPTLLVDESINNFEHEDTLKDAVSLPLLLLKRGRTPFSSIALHPRCSWASTRPPIPPHRCNAHAKTHTCSHTKGLSKCAAGRRCTCSQHCQCAVVTSAAEPLVHSTGGSSGSVHCFLSPLRLLSRSRSKLPWPFSPPLPPNTHPCANAPLWGWRRVCNLCTCESRGGKSVQFLQLQV